jgi:hypothetical protein
MCVSITNHSPLLAVSNLVDTIGSPAHVNHVRPVVPGCQSFHVIEPRVQTIKAKQDIWIGGPESLGAYWMTETGKHPELYAFFPIGHLR